MSKKISVKIAAPIMSINSFGECARQVAIALSEIGIDVAIHDTTQPNDFQTRIGSEMMSKINTLKQVVLQKPYVFIHINNPERINFVDNNAVANIAWTAVDTNEIPMLSAVMLENAAITSVWTPSQWQESIFKNYKGLEKKTSTVSWGVDYDGLAGYTDKFDSIRKDGNFYFGFVGSMKLNTGVDIAVSAFYDEFKNEDNVKFILKTFMGSLDPVKEKEVITNILKPLKKDSKAEVIHINGGQPSYVIEKTINTCDCLVMPSRAKAWNSNVLRAMALGVPVIANKYSGNRAYTSDINVVPISSKHSVIRHPMWLTENPIYQSCSWFEPNVDEVKRAMRMVYEKKTHPEMTRYAKEKAAKLDWKNIALEVIKNIKKFEAK